METCSPLEWIAMVVVAVVVAMAVAKLVVGVIPKEFNCDSVGFT